MAYNFNNVIFDDLIATNGTNYHNPTEQEMNEGILPNTGTSSELVNSFLYKCSAAVKQIEENGAVCFIPGKTYQTGNIVTCNVLANNSISVYIFRCTKDNNTTYPLEGIQLNDDNGYVYFTGLNANEGWERIFLYGEEEKVLEIPEFKKNGADLQNIDYKYISIINNTSIGGATEFNVEYKLTIERADSYLTCSLAVNYFNGQMRIYLYNIMCDNYSLDSNTSIWNDNSIFKDLALLGCILVVDNNELNLVMSPRKFDSLIDNDKIVVRLEQVFGEQITNFVELQSGGRIIEKEVYKIPFINGASNEYNKSFMLFDTFEELDYIQKYKKGLVGLNDAVLNNPSIYSFLYAFEGRFGAKISDFRDHYTSVVQGQDKEPENRDLNDKLYSLTDINATFKGTIVQGSEVSFAGENLYGINTNYGQPKSTGMFDPDLGDKLNMYNIASARMGSNYASATPNSPALRGTGSLIYLRGKVSNFKASLSSSTYSTKNQDLFYLNSTKIFKYMYFI